MNILRAVYDHDLNRHFIFTFPGKSARDFYGYEQSFRLMNREWNKLRQVILRKYPDFQYIVLPRAQASPYGGNPAGFCHYHLLSSTFVGKAWLQSKIVRNRYAFGHLRLKYNQSVAEYLYKDFFSDDEWVIPAFVKHYRCSRDIVMDPGKGTRARGEFLYFQKGTSLPYMEGVVNDSFHRPLPFEEYVKLFFENLKKTQAK